MRKVKVELFRLGWNLERLKWVLTKSSFTNYSFTILASVLTSSPSSFLVFSNWFPESRVSFRVQGLIGFLLLGVVTLNPLGKGDVVICYFFWL